MIMTFYTIFISPIKLGFYRVDIFTPWSIFENLVDIMFYLDMFLSFFTPIHKNNKLHTTVCGITKAYLTSWFLFDLITNINFELFLGANPEDSDNFIIRMMFSGTRTYKAVRCLRFLRIARIFRKHTDNFLQRFFKRLIKDDNMIVSIIPTYMVLFMIVHLFSCIWHFNSNNVWEKNSWLVRHDYNSEPEFDKYIVSLYFIYTTMTTTGYGDILPGTISEYLLTSIFMILGVLFYSIIYSNITNKLDERFKKNQEYQSKYILLIQLKKDASIFR